MIEVVMFQVRSYNQSRYNVRSTSATGGTLIQPWQFSSEYHDDATGLVYYNYRYYSPELGRWIKRDPIEEQGGVNLYGIVGNNSVSFCDIFGMTQGCCGKDITVQLNKLLKKVYEEVQKLNYYKPDIIINVKDGWDIEELHTDDYSRLNTANYNSAHLCYATATYNGKCYRSQDLNYMLFAAFIEAKGNFLENYKSKEFGETVLIAYVIAQTIAERTTLNMNKLKIYNATSAQIKKLSSNKIDTIDLSQYGIQYVDCVPSQVEYTGVLNANFQGYLNDHPQTISVP